MQHWNLDTPIAAIAGVLVWVAYTAELIQHLYEELLSGLMVGAAATIGSLVIRRINHLYTRAARSRAARAGGNKPR